MGKIKNTSGQDVTVPWLNDRLVVAGQVVEVPDADVWAYTQQVENTPDLDGEGEWTGEWSSRPQWEPVGETQAVHEAAAIVATAAQYATDGIAVVEPDGNASRIEWGAYVVAAEHATPDALVDLSRDEIRDRHKTIYAEDAPPQSALKAEWVDFVMTSHGVSREVAEAMTKAELIAFPYVPGSPAAADLPWAPPATPEPDAGPDDDPQNPDTTTPQEG